MAVTNVCNNTTSFITPLSDFASPSTTSLEDAYFKGLNKLRGKLSPFQHKFLKDFFEKLYDIQEKTIQELPPPAIDFIELDFELIIYRSSRSTSVTLVIFEDADVALSRLEQYPNKSPLTFYTTSSESFDLEALVYNFLK